MTSIIDAASATGRFDVFEPGDKTALVCMDVPEMERLAIDQLRELGYKVNAGLSVDDLLFKLRTHSYDVILVAENYGASNIATNPLLSEINRAPASQRRRQLIVLIGASLHTANDNEAFQHSVDVVVALADIGNLRPVIRRAAVRSQEFYGRYLEAVAAADVV
jgi:CheY-like chemotaxis protein